LELGTELPTMESKQQMMAMEDMPEAVRERSEGKRMTDCEGKFLHLRSDFGWTRFMPWISASRICEDDIWSWDFA
jgi:hypothetical protein